MTLWELYGCRWRQSGNNLDTSHYFAFSTVNTSYNFAPTTRNTTDNTTTTETHNPPQSKTNNNDSFQRYEHDTDNFKCQHWIRPSASHLHELLSSVFLWAFCVPLYRILCSFVHSAYVATCNWVPSPSIFLHYIMSYVICYIIPMMRDENTIVPMSYLWRLMRHTWVIPSRKIIA